MKKRISFLLILTLCLSLCSLVGCNRVDAGKLSDIAGTYELTEYTITNVYDRNNQTIPESERVTQDLIKEAGIRTYLVIPTSGPCYYVYRDGETDWYAIETRPHFDYETHNEEDGTTTTTDLIRHITLDGNAGFECSLYVQAKSKTFTDNKSAWRSSFTGIFTGNKYYIGNKAKVNIKYSRISDKATLDFVCGKIKTDLTPTSYELAPFLLTKAFTCTTFAADPESAPLYDYYFFDSAAGTVKHCYAERSENPEKMEETLPFSYDAEALRYRIGDVSYTYVEGENFSLTSEDQSHAINPYSVPEAEIRENFDLMIREYLDYLAEQQQ